MATTIIRFLNIILVALLAGTSFGIWVGLNPVNYSSSTYIEQQQHLVLSLQTLLVSLVIVATLVTIASAFLQREDRKTFIALLVAAGFLLLCIVVTRFGNLPIQTEMLTWDTHAVPDNWTMLRDQWWSFHVLRTVAELVALALVAWTSVQKGNA
ncbi:DUF1772 domain-containing protein [Chryseolinea soli]|uniref:DUF1772 domain-containing protein n=1 Tax=Chryseolinea soli TaxID=2321403 RepID=A0A385SX34_9BACT|nr:DUF1772 domain-containing protein [Chryseolinea soli]AYB35176.1 DUF1772 domain-containing protein [Chryseolinea soli]